MSTNKTLISPAAYNSLPTYREVFSKGWRVPDEVAKKIEELFKKYGLTETIDIHPVFRSTGICEDEIAAYGIYVHPMTGPMVKSKPATVYDKEKYCPIRYLIDRDGKFQAFEFAKMSTPAFDTERHQECLTELKDIIVSHGLQHLIGLSVLGKIKNNHADQQSYDIWKLYGMASGSLDQEMMALELPPNRTTLFAPSEVVPPVPSWLIEAIGGGRRAG